MPVLKLKIFFLYFQMVLVAHFTARDDIGSTSLKRIKEIAYIGDSHTFTFLTRNVLSSFLTCFELFFRAMWSFSLRGHTISY